MGRVVKNLKSGKIYLDTELDPKELAVIGRVTVLWGRVEHLLMQMTIELAAGDHKIEKRAFDDVFSVRLRTFFELARSVEDQAQRERYLKIHSKIANLMRRRHQLTHGFWDWDHSDPDNLKVIGTRPSREFEASWDVEKLYDFGSLMGEVLFELQFPGGYEEFLQQRTEAGGSISRNALRLFSGTLPDDRPLARNVSSAAKDSDA